MIRDFVTYEGHNGATLEVHRVTSKTAGEATVVGGPVVQVKEGDVLVKTQNGNYVDVHKEDVLDAWGYTATRDQYDHDDDEDRADAKAAEDHGFFEPEEHSAKEVHAYLSDPKVSDDNKERVRLAEENGKNRQSAIPR